MSTTLVGSAIVISFAVANQHAAHAQAGGTVPYYRDYWEPTWPHRPGRDYSYRPDYGYPGQGYTVSPFAQYDYRFDRGDRLPYRWRVLRGVPPWARYESYRYDVPSDGWPDSPRDPSQYSSAYRYPGYAIPPGFDTEEDLTRYREWALRGRVPWAGDGQRREFKNQPADDPALDFRFGDAMSPSYLKVDRDNDGKVSDEEATLATAARFELLDTDGDEQVSMDEFVRGNRTLYRSWIAHDFNYESLRELLDSRFAGYDGNDGDNIATRREFFAQAEELFNGADENQDGVTSVWEYRARHILN